MRGGSNHLSIFNVFRTRTRGEERESDVTNFNVSCGRDQRKAQLKEQESGKVRNKRAQSSFTIFEDKLYSSEWRIFPFCTCMPIMALQNTLKKEETSGLLWKLFLEHFKQSSQWCLIVTTAHLTIFVDLMESIRIWTVWCILGIFKYKKQQHIITNHTLSIKLPASLAVDLGSAVTSEANESWRRHFMLNRSHTYKDPFLVTRNNFQLSSQSMNTAADPIIMVGMARLPHFVYTFRRTNTYTWSIYHKGKHN